MKSPFGDVPPILTSIFLCCCLLPLQLWLWIKLTPDLLLWDGMTEALCVDGRSLGVDLNAASFSLELGNPVHYTGYTWDAEIQCEIPVTAYKPKSGTLLMTSHPEGRLPTGELCTTTISDEHDDSSCTYHAPAAARWCIQQIKAEPYACFVNPANPDAGVRDSAFAFPATLAVAAALMLLVSLATLFGCVIPGMFNNGTDNYLDNQMQAAINCIMFTIFCVIGLIVIAGKSYPLPPTKFSTTVAEFEAHSLHMEMPVRQWSCYDTATGLAMIFGTCMFAPLNYRCYLAILAIGKKRSPEIQRQADEYDRMLDHARDVINN